MLATLINVKVSEMLLCIFNLRSLFLLCFNKTKSQKGQMSGVVFQPLSFLHIFRNFNFSIIMYACMCVQTPLLFAINLGYQNMQLCYTFQIIERAEDCNLTILLSDLSFLR